MSIVSLPSVFRATNYESGQLRFDTIERSDSTGDESARLLAPPRWTASIQSVDHMTLSEAGQWKGWLLQLRGSVNVAALYDPVRVQPEGTMRGSTTVGVAAAAGATSVTIGGATGANLLRFASAYNNAVWTRTNVTVNTNATTAPDGTTTADRLVENTANAEHGISQAVTVVSGQVYTVSIRAKADTRSVVYINLADSFFGNNSNASFNLSAVTAQTPGSGTASITSLGSGWYLCSLTMTATASGSALCVFLQATVYGSAQSNATYTGDGASGLYFWGAVAEAASTASSSMPYPTLLAGDWLTFGSGLGTSQRVCVVADVTGTAYTEAQWLNNASAQAIWSGSGGQATWSQDGSPSQSLTPTFEPPLRSAYAAGTPVNWDRPIFYARMQGNAKWAYSTQAWAREGGFAADFVETFNA